MRNLYVGFDISKDWIDMAVCNHEAVLQSEPSRFENTEKGISRAIKAIVKFKTPVKACFEHSGNYGLLLACFLEKHSLFYSAVSPLEIKRSVGLTRGKTDRVDAVRIARYAAIHHRKLRESKLPGDNLLKLKHLLSYRNQLVDLRRQLDCSIKSYKVSHKTINLEDTISSIELNINHFATQIKQTDTQIMHLIESNKAIHKNYQLICSVTGIGPIIAANFLVYTCNFTLFEDPRKFICYAGIAPFEHSSGSSVKGKTRTSSLRNKKIKALLFNGANCAALYDQQLKTYYNRKRQEGKHRMVVLNAIAAKLIYRVFSVIKRQTPYVKFAQ